MKTIALAIAAFCAASSAYAEEKSAPQLALTQSAPPVTADATDPARRALQFDVPPAPLYKSKLLWTGFALSVAGLGIMAAGLAQGFQALNQARDATCYGGCLDDASTQATRADVMTGVGASGAALGFVSMVGAAIWNRHQLNLFAARQRATARR